MNKLNPFIRMIISFLLGVIIAFCVILLAETLNAKLFPSKHLNPSFMEMQQEIDTLPAQAFLLVLLGYALSSFFGAYVAGRVAPSAYKFWMAMSIGFFLLLGGIVNFIAFPHPVWLSVSASISFLLFAFLGGKLAKESQV